MYILITEPNKLMCQQGMSMCVSDKGRESRTKTNKDIPAA